MKTFACAVAALAGVVAASAALQSPEAYIISGDQESPHSRPTLSRELARLVLLQRLSPDPRAASLDGLSDLAGVTVDTAIGYINTYGKAGAELFQEQAGGQQMLVMVEGVSGDQATTIRDKLGRDPSFLIGGKATKVANRHLVEDELWRIGVAGESGCDLLDASCWDSPSVAVRYDAGEPSDLTKLLETLPMLRQAAEEQKLEAVVVLFPTLSDGQAADSWSNDLRRRQSEAVISSESVAPSPEPADSSPARQSSAAALLLKGSALPSCFDSLDACQSQTANCSSHGNCIDIYEGSDLKEPKTCFTCHCLISGEKDPEPFTHWGGRACEKIDVSTPFWLFVGFTVLMVFIISAAVGMLYGVGEEKLPGVIGAGVSKSK